MKITRVSAIVLRLPQVTAACDGTQETLLVKIQTDAGRAGSLQDRLAVGRELFVAQMGVRVDPVHRQPLGILA